MMCANCRSAVRGPGWLALVGSLFLFGFAPAGRQGEQIASDPPAVLIRRIVLLVQSPQEASSIRVQRIIAAERTARAKSRRRRSASPLAPRTVPPAEAGGMATPEQLQIIAQALFEDALTERLWERLRVTVVPEAEVKAALVALSLSPTEAGRPEGARRLCAQLDCDALLVPILHRVMVREGATRDVALWADLRIPYQSAAGEANRWARIVPVRPPANFTVAGAVSVGRVLFHTDYLKTLPHAVAEAVQQAASRAVHTLWTGARAPLTQEGERIALTPVTAPAQADKLLFTPQGRRLLSTAVRGLPSDVSAWFKPNLLPLFEDAICGPEATRQALRQEAQQPADLWAREGVPDRDRVRALGRRLHVDYILLAHVTDVEVEEGPEPVTGQATGSGSPQASRVCEARAETVGALVRVGDGALLWKGRATATMTGHLPPDSSSTAENPAIQAAIRFALIQLQRDFQRYRDRFDL